MLQFLSGSLLKSMWKSLAASINEDSAAQIANTVEPMEVGSLLI